MNLDDIKNDKTEFVRPINAYEYGMGVSESDQLNTDIKKEDKETENDNVNVHCFKLEENGREVCMAWEKRK